jgi:acyl dehydratase
MLAMADTATTESIAIADPPEIQKANPIHAEGAAAYGYDRPIVAGLSSYGWAAASVIELLGEEWLDAGWADMAFLRPVFAGDRLVTTATRTGGQAGPDDASGATCTYVQRNESGKVTVEGRAGLGVGPFEWQLPARRDPVPPAEHRPLMLPDQAPVGEDYPPMAVDLTVDGTRAWSTERLGDHHPRYHDGPHPRAHPSWVPGQMTPLIRHSYRFAAGIHTTGRVQHLRSIRAPRRVVVAGRWISNEVRKGKWWSTSDAVFLDEDGRELAYCQQAQILLPPLQ